MTLAPHKSDQPGATPVPLKSLLQDKGLHPRLLERNDFAPFLGERLCQAMHGPTLHIWFCLISVSLRKAHCAVMPSLLAHPNPSSRSLPCSL